ncbi:hypothetical protein P879_08967 [Paragonimus westermani]|uniref:Uncharacterized protein n=1 Tax=Paragonimus westermani TaxID=34504 RepID=A0A8T0DF82_9TREM|nr:hypothetical protein P879_08967 [Paragonimus westermani]
MKTKWKYQNRRKMSSESKETRNFSQNKFNEPAHLIAEDDLNSWKRSKSDASFFPGVENHETEKTGGPTGNVSEHAMVYWNLPEAVEASDSDALLFAMSHTGDDDSKLQTTIPEQTYEMQRIVAKSEKIAMKADTSEVHVHRVHFKDGHPRQLSSSSPQKDEFCRRQSSPASPYDSSVRTAETHVAILTDHRTSRLQTDETLDIEKSYSTVLSEKATHYAHYGGSALESTRQVISGSMNSEFLRKVNEISMNAMHRLRPSDSTATAPSLFRTKSLEEEEGKAEEKSPSFELGSFEELQKNMSLQFEKLRLFSQLDRSTGTKDNEGIKILVDGEYEVDGKILDDVSSSSSFVTLYLFL